MRATCSPSTKIEVLNLIQGDDSLDLQLFYLFYLFIRFTPSQPKNPASRKALTLQEERYRQRSQAGCLMWRLRGCKQRRPVAGRIFSAALRTNPMRTCLSWNGLVFFRFCLFISSPPSVAVARNMRRRVNLIIASQVLADAICISAPSTEIQLPK